MLMDMCSFRSFISNYTDFKEIDSDLETLVLKYRQTNDPRYFATIYNKVAGVIFKAGSKTSGALTDADMFSHGVEALYHALSETKYGWKPESKIKFLTYYTRMVGNFVYTLQHSRHFRDINLHQVSLDELIDDPDNPKSFDESQMVLPIRKTTYEHSDVVERLREICNNQKLINQIKEDFGEDDRTFKITLLKLKKKFRVATKEEKRMLNLALKAAQSLV